jgi:hypothetical protein
MKRMLAICVAILAVASFAGCGNEKERDINKYKDKPKASEVRKASFNQQNGTLRPKADAVAHTAPAGAGRCRIEPRGSQDDEINGRLGGVAHALRGAIAEANCASAGYLSLLKLSS